jgi:large conductance mechanosensitive channel
MLKEFKAFIAKGNVIELAVGLIMATYFGAIVKSLVDDVVMPPVGMLLGGVDFSDFKVVLKEATTNEAGVAVAEVSLKYGSFLNNIITFIIVAFAVFLVVKAYNEMKNRMEKKAAAAPAPPVVPTKEEMLLTEIRDLLKK